jgi:hypothetical protein
MAAPAAGKLFRYCSKNKKRNKISKKKIKRFLSNPQSGKRSKVK